ncbi:MAG: cytochrome b/b6 domain-containing protein [Anaerolineae bacterium]|nr:cytochrome b/b6 domain-containing protein [Anaerolineae bacterium]NUQ06783.1 cytochrome b/b6 domain-containing protein [Anaerolineae bacterium]
MSLSKGSFAGRAGARPYGAWLLTLSAVAFILAAVLLLAPAGAQAQESPLHPTFPLLDAEGGNVVEIGAPISTLKTCGSCHDSAFITEHDMHAALWSAEAAAWDPLTYGRRARQGDEINCFLCHSGDANNAARLEALAAGEIAWANTATLIVEPVAALVAAEDGEEGAVSPEATAEAAAFAEPAAAGIVVATESGYAYNPDAFAADGSLKPEYVNIQDPRSDACGSCHGQVHMQTQTPLALSVCDDSQARTFTTGQVVSPQRISSSGANVADRDTLARPWDIHAERVLTCVDCHYSVNNPVYTTSTPSGDLEHLTFDPRRLDFGEYLERPSHQFANGSDGSPSCTNCHDASVSHGWLPYLERHTSALACESCHVPQLYAPALASRDWTVLTADGAPVDTCRGIDGGIASPPDSPAAALITGYQPTLLQDVDADGSSALSPYNLVTVSYWVAGDDAQPVELEAVRAAYLDGGAYAAEVLALFDGDADGALSSAELMLDSSAKTDLIAARLAGQGIAGARISAEIVPYPIHHGVIGGSDATRDCQTCHQEDSRITAAFPLGAASGGATPTLAEDSGVRWNGSVGADGEGLLTFQPETQTPAAQLYIFGRDSQQVIDLLGVLILLGTSLGVTAHASLRVIAARRAQQGGQAHHGVQREYLYSIYERQWHWLQTAVIFGLTFTGLVIHRPQYFSAFSFAWMVDLHNVLALILVINAALSLFYHLASGEIKQFIPRPYGFFDQAIQQALFYLRGIFRGDPHPFEKTRDHKMNPLQQMTYFGILNVLLPLQIITGALMWGAQQFPALTNLLGGLPVLAPFHTLIAWLFVTFIIAHVYLTTTGHEPLAGIKAMVGGYDAVESAETGAASSAKPSAETGD